MPRGTPVKKLISALRHLMDDRAGNFALLTALMIVPVIGMSGLAVDYTNALMTKSALGVAADAAAVDSVSESAQATVFTATTPLETSLTVAGAKASTMFKGNLAGSGVNIPVTVTPVLVRSGAYMTATIGYSANVPTTFMRIFGVRTIRVSGKAVATSGVPTFIDFHLFLDNSPSMGVAATDADAAKMLSTLGCEFACHDVSSPNDSLAKVRAQGISVRFDVLKAAVKQMADAIVSTRAVSNQYRVALHFMQNNAVLYPTYPVNNSMKTFTSDMTLLKSNVDKIDLMQVPYPGYNIDALTNIPGALQAFYSWIIDPPGNGSSAATPQKVLMMVTDGVDDAIRPAGCTQQLYGDQRCQEPLNNTYCTAIKNRGIQIAVLYTTYRPLPTNGWYNTYIAPFQGSIGKNLQSCASPGLYYEVGFDGSIKNAMEALFRKVISQPRLTD